MADKIFKVRLQLRNDTEANWQAIGDTFIPLAGEACVTNDGENKGRFKIGAFFIFWRKELYEKNVVSNKTYWTINTR